MRDIGYWVKQQQSELNGQLVIKNIKIWLVVLLKYNKNELAIWSFSKETSIIVIKAC